MCKNKNKLACILCAIVIIQKKNINEGQESRERERERERERGVLVARVQDAWKVDNTHSIIVNDRAKKTHTHKTKIFKKFFMTSGL